MARSDLLIALVRAGSSGDKIAVRVTAEAIIAEERAKQHNVLAERLLRVIQVNGGGAYLKSPAGLPTQPDRGREFLGELIPHRKLEDLVLADDTITAIRQLIEEQLRASLLRSHGLDPRHRVLLVGVAPDIGRCCPTFREVKNLSK